MVNNTKEKICFGIDGCKKQKLNICWKVYLRYLLYTCCPTTSYVKRTTNY